MPKKKYKLRERKIHSVMIHLDKEREVERKKDKKREKDSERQKESYIEKTTYVHGDIEIQSAKILLLPSKC